MNKKVKNIIMGVLTAIFFIVTLGFVSVKSSESICKGIDINIVDTSQNLFIEKNDILTMVYKRQGRLEGYPITGINLNKLESVLGGHPSVNNAEVFKTPNGFLRIELSQRYPLVRVVNVQNKSYYLDERAMVMPLSSKFTARVIVASGFINESATIRTSSYILDTVRLKGAKVLRDIYAVVSYLQKNKLLRCMFEQIYINQNQEFELVPKVGSHIVLLGDINNLEQKFSKLLTFYREGMPKVGWNIYKQINLKFKDQVVCTRR